MSDKKLNPQYKKFADEYMDCWNGTRAAIKAGYKPKNAAHQASEMLKRPEVREYIDKTLAERAASANETMSFLTAVMRGEVKDAFGLDASLSDRIGAAKELMKRHELDLSRKKQGGDEEDALSRALREEAEAMERERTGENAPV